MNAKKSSLALSLLNKTISVLTNIRQAMPHRCLLCHQQTNHYAAHLCLSCRQDLPFPDFQCLGCASELHTATMWCGECIANTPSHVLITACDYLSPLKELITSLKYRHNTIAAYELALHLSKRIEHNLERKFIEQPQLLVPVPLHPSRYRKRGFNQAHHIAYHLGKLLDIEVADCCIRTIATPAQAQLSAKQRQHNLDGAFELPTSLSVQHIALIDDVYTTGATMRELTNTINQHQAIKIQYWCIARTLI